MGTTKPGDNPIKEERKRLHLTIDQLCKRAFVSKSLVIKNEQGSYPEPSHRIVLFFRREIPDFKDREREFYDRYYRWQAAVRRAHYGILSEPFPLQSYLSRLPVGAPKDAQKLDEPFYHPLEYWRLNSAGKPNLNQISKGLCIHQGLLFKFEQQPHLVNSVPEPVVTALLEAGYSVRTIHDLELAYTEYKQYIRNLSQRVQANGTYRPADFAT